MRKIILLSLSVLFFSQIAFSQAATKIDEIGYFSCGDNYRLDLVYQNEIKAKPQNKIFIIFYEGQRDYQNFNYKTQKYETVIEKPKFGNALNRAKEIPLYLKMVYKVPNDRFVLVNGGFRQKFVMEIWSVPKDASLPKATPTLERKEIKFVKGKPKPPRKMACCYESC
ncbi:MAG: hypothetical protein K1X72_12615 [Pyrinomonadaceae bacterium]|nr:hypothetical protein [Pyrinomonadaceae bacterium]